MPLLFFWINSSNSFDYDEKGVIGVSEVAEHQFVLKIQVAPILGALAPSSHEIWA